MKTIKLMMMALMMCFTMVGFSQSDTIVKTNDEVISGVKISKVTSTTIWYTQNKVGKSIPLSDVKSHTYILEIKTTEKEKTTKITTEEVSKLECSAFKSYNSYTEYVSSNNFEIKVGDTIKLGLPSDKTFQYVYSGEPWLSGVQLAQSNSAGSIGIIKSIYIQGTKQTGCMVYINTVGYIKFYIQVENAILSKELTTPNFLSSDEALAELKRWKDKLDLGLIKQEEFDAKKAELSKYIK